MAQVSVVIPVYNVERYLDRCVQSVLNQTLKDIEIILVDDGSPDNCPQMCDDYARRYDNIKVVHKTNAGLGMARNTGLAHCQGEYVAFIDSDDYIDSEMIERLVTEAVINDSDAVFCGFNLQTTKGVWHKSKEVAGLSRWEDDDILSFMLDMVASDKNVRQERKFYMSVWHSIYRRSLIVENSISFLSERNILSEDIPFQIDFLKKAKRVSYIPYNGYFYCSNPKSLTASFNIDKFDRSIALYRLLIQQLAEVDGGIERACRLFIGYSRTLIHQLCSSYQPNKIEILNKICANPIWGEIQEIYPTSYIQRKDTRLMYRLTLKKNCYLLYINSLLVNRARAILSHF